MIGEQLRDEGIDRVLSADANEEWRDAAYRWMEALPIGRIFTSNDLVEQIGMPPSPNAVGAIMRAAGVQGITRNTGVYRKSARPSCHAAILALWVRE